ncbi:NAD(P)-binding protein [Coccomyxa subellipsoidea C-169]|uniref:NAD(P)-binding protein n=1 Tax=Coccomyxa subellipsoidea (strain C-169) TaxID=574566 RepID=I0Z4D7_COCSC|nr:NAD(P)-binding protein [Coccomyxa subellipsoidea C-169]EIE25506.1 NAD(P)-binding protein [Coccomyxa subellipsoidea C-169]|eukprot:XP_005650050.1 NAD(P)-binding protein [Coccomyxa subellipsoidea C-169]
MGKQTAVVVRQYNKDNPPEALDVVTKDIPEPKAGMGVIEKLGPQPSKLPTETARQKLKEGQRVVAVPWPSTEGEGTWQQYVAVPLENLVPVRDEVSNEDASQYLVNPVTALGFLEDLKIPKGKYLLQNAANSVLGKEVISLAKKQGIKTINVVRRNEVINELKELGADEVINSKTDDIVARVKEITGVYVPVVDLLWRDITVRGFWLNVWLGRLPKDVKEQKLQEVMDLMADGTIKPPPARAKYPLKEVKKALEDAMSKSGSAGKVLLEG